ncbi:MAG: AAA family ATPase, partial [Bacteroidota bacterium]
MQKLPIGIQDFRVLREGNYLYVDKTALLFQLISTSKYVFLARPRRFGKSLLVSTIRELFNASRSLFVGLDIETKYDWQQRYPVIQLSFASLGYQELGLQQALLTRLDEWAATY